MESKYTILKHKYDKKEKLIAHQKADLRDSQKTYRISSSSSSCNRTHCTKQYDEIKRLENRLDYLSSENKKLKGSNENLHRKLKEEEEVNKSRKRKFEKLLEEKKDLEERQSKRIKICEEKIKAFKSQRIEAENRIKHLENQKDKESNHTIDSLNERIETLRAELKTANDQINQHIQVSDKLKSQVEFLSNTLEIKNEEKTKLEEQFKQMTDKYQQIQKSKNKAAGIKQTNMLHLKEIKKQLEDTKKELQELQGKLVKQNIISGKAHTLINTFSKGISDYEDYRAKYS